MYAMYFRSSLYRTFAEKMKAFEKQENGWRDQVHPYVHNINTNLKEAELFDAFEMGAAGLNAQMLSFTAQLNQTEWYNQTLYKGMYQTQTGLQVPEDKISILQMQAPSKQLTDDEIRLNVPSGYAANGVMRYELAYYCAKDLYTAKENTAMKFLGGQTISATETALLNQDFPPVVFQGNYPVKVSYSLPGRNIVTSSVGINIYNPIINQ
jgi:hypothetical protein